MAAKGGEGSGAGAGLAPEAVGIASSEPTLCLVVGEGAVRARRTSSNEHKKVLERTHSARSMPDMAASCGRVAGLPSPVVVPATAEPAETVPKVRLLLWAPPRSMSTAFERSLMQHADVSVHHELLADCFYFGNERHPKKLDPAIERSKLLRDTTYTKQLALLSSAAANDGRRVAFSKELSIYYQPARLPPSVLAQYTHAFLIRKPEKVMRSFMRVAEKSGASSSTYFDVDEVGFHELELLFQVVTGELRATPVIIDADDLVAAPEKVLRAWCAAVGLPFDERMLFWLAEMPQQWTKWPGWHDDAAKSTGFAPPRHAAGAVEAPPLPADAQRAVDMAQPVYEKLYAMCTR